MCYILLQHEAEASLNKILLILHQHQNVQIKYHEDIPFFDLV